MDDAEKYQAIKAIYRTLDKPTPPETVYIEPTVGPAWLYVDGTWFEAGLEDHALFLVRWHREAEARWGEFGTRMNVSAGVLSREQCEVILKHVRATA